MADPHRGELPFDELRDSAGNVRAHWQRYFEQLDQIGTAEAKARWTKAKKLLEEGRIRKEANLYYPMEAFKGPAFRVHGSVFSRKTH